MNTLNLSIPQPHHNNQVYSLINYEDNITREHSVLTNNNSQRAISVESYASSMNYIDQI